MRIGKPAFWFVALFMVVMLGLLGYWMLFSNFAAYDDEGYILISARQYFLHGKLYEGVYSQYGPAYYCTMNLFQGIFGPVDNTLARFLTLGFWLGTALCCGGMVWRQTSSRSLVLFTLPGVFLYLYFITDEPFHPGSLIFFILASSLWGSTELIAKAKLAGAGALMGTTGAFLLLTKINVGVFYVMGVAVWAVMQVASGKPHRSVRPGLVVFLSVFAAAVMHTLIREPWVQTYLLVFACGSTGLLAVSRSDGFVTWKLGAWFFAASFVTGAVVLFSIWLHGTSLAGLLEGVVLGPLRHPGNYSYPIDWRPGTIVLAIASITFACSLPAITRRKGADYTDRLIVTLRIMASLALLVGIAVLIDQRTVGAVFSYFVSLIWLWVVPLSPRQSHPRTSELRGLLASVLLLQFLHAYPVGGAQESWGSFLFIPLVAIGLGDARRWLATQVPSGAIQRFAWTALGGLLSLVAAAKTGVTVLRTHRDFVAQSPLNLPGAAAIRLPVLRAATYRVLALNAAIHSDVLFSMPGMFSFNLWTSLPPPTDKNTTLWFNLLSDSEQKEIIKTCEESARVGLIVHDDLVSLMKANHVQPHGMLWSYLEQNFTPAFKSGGLTFWTKRSHPITPFNIATLRTRTGPPPRTVGNRTHQLDFSLVSDGTAIATIEISNPNLGSNPLVLDAHNAEATSVAVSRDGQQVSPSVTHAWPLQRKGLIHFTLHFDRNDFPFAADQTVIVLRGVSGESLGDLRLAE